MVDDSDLATRERLLQRATALFAERGFEKVTVRDIVAAAGANVAAVNYHFAGKLGLYTEVIHRAIALMQTARDETRNALTGSSAAERL
ncbi:MAG: TetR family transcriptional regulator, partial [Gemmatimonadota bacterium]